MTDSKPSFRGINAARERSNRRADGSSQPINWPALAEPVARALLGDPNPRLSRRRVLRYGQRGSLSIDVGRGLWTDFEAQESGGVLDLITRERRCDTAGAMRWLAEQGWLDGTPMPSDSEPPPPMPADDVDADKNDAARVALVDALWRAAVPADKTPARAYLARRLTWPPAGIKRELPATVRWLDTRDAPGRRPDVDWYGLPREAAGALACAWTRPEESEPPRAVSLEALTGTGALLSARWRRTWGPRAGCACIVQDAPPSAPVHIAEGELDALALVHWLAAGVLRVRILAAGGTAGLRHAPAWATGPVTLWADGDPGGRRAAELARHAIAEVQPVAIEWCGRGTDPADQIGDWLSERAAMREEQGEDRDAAEVGAWRDLMERGQ